MRHQAPFLLVLAACGALRESPLAGSGDDAPDDSLADAGALDAEPSDADSRDAAPEETPPVLREDVACEGANAWYAASRTAECESRTIRLVQAVPPDAFTAHGNLDIAWSLAARAGIVLAWESGVEAGYLQALTFDTASAAFTVRLDRAVPAFDYQIEGAGARIAARADGSFEVLSMLDESRNGGDVLLRRLPADQPFLDPDVVFVGAHRSAQLGLIVHPSGLVTATAAVPDSEDLTLQTKQRRPEAMVFDTLQGGNLDYFGQGPYSNGNHRMAVDALGVTHIVYEQGFGAARSQPRYGRLAETGWDFRRTVDNPTVDGPSGASISLSIFGDEKNAVYVQQARDADGETLPYGQIVRARWRGNSDPIVRSVLVDQLPLALGDDGPNLNEIRAAAAMDASGALHVAYAVRTEEDSGNGTCTIHYLREAARGGAIVLLHDDVSPQIACASAPPVALAVEPGGRPHLTYVSPAQGVLYATRYDR